MKTKVILLITIALIAFASYQRFFHGTEIDKANAERSNLEKLKTQADSLKKANENFLRNCHFLTKKSIRKTLKDPDSFEELSHNEFMTTAKNGSRIYAQCVIEYTATNSFNARIRNQKTASFNNTGVLIEVF